jgi:tetratricopeptide (TPR) repeat protein
MDIEAERRRQLEEVIAQSDAIIAECADDLDDPVAADRADIAHFKRARALRGLGRHQQSLEDWDRFLSSWGQRYPNASGRPRQRLAAALTLKCESLWFTGRRREASLLDEEVAERFGDDLDPSVRWLVMLALVRRAGRLLDRPGGVGEALGVSDLLITRFLEDPQERLADSADLLLGHARSLMAVYRLGVVALLGATAETAVNAGIEGVGAVATRVGSMVNLPGADELLAASDRLRPAVTDENRRRAAQALAVCDAVLARLDGSDDPALATLAVQARFVAGCGLLQSGRPIEGFRVVNAIQANHDFPTVQALSDMADLEAQKPGWVAKVGTAAMLSHRANSLVGEDPRLARIAYDDSVAERLPAKLPLLVRLAVRLMRPGSGPDRA